MSQQKQAPVRTSHSVHPFEQLPLNPVHLTWRDSTVLCGAEITTNTLAYHQWNAGIVRWSTTCPDCRHVYEHPAAVPVRSQVA
jgi:hypothetical protein